MQVCFRKRLCLRNQVNNNSIISQRYSVQRTQSDTKENTRSDKWWFLSQLPEQLSELAGCSNVATGQEDHPSHIVSARDSTRLAAGLSKCLALSGVELESCSCPPTAAATTIVSIPILQPISSSSPLCTLHSSLASLLSSLFPPFNPLSFSVTLLHTNCFL